MVIYKNKSELPEHRVKVNFPTLNFYNVLPQLINTWSVKLSLNKIEFLVHISQNFVQTQRTNNVFLEYHEHNIQNPQKIGSSQKNLTQYVQLKVEDLAMLFLQNILI